jgi:hypothetical protein
MTLKILILSLLHTHGPMREVDLLLLTPERFLATVTLACIELQNEELIELPRGTRPISFSWQLTEKGRQWKRPGKNKQEVSLGSH